MDFNTSVYIKAGLVNIQSVGNKTLEIRDLINYEKFDILAVTETWLNEYDTAKINEMTPSTHTFLHIPRNDKRGSGVVIFFRNSVKKLRVYKSEIFDSFENMWVGCEIAGRKCMFIVVYRPPNLSASSFIEDFRLFLETNEMVSFNVFVCGDFNLWIDNQEDDNVKKNFGNNGFL